MSTLRRLYDRHGNSLREFIKFGLIGGSGVVVNLLAIGLAHNVFFHGFQLADDFAVWNIPGTRWSVRMYHLYAIFAFFVANTYNFVLNRYWTFKGERAPFFKEFVIRLPKPVDAVNAALAAEGIIGGLDLGRFWPEMADAMLVCVTEKRSKAEIDRFVERLGAIL